MLSKKGPAPLVYATPNSLGYSRRFPQLAESWRVNASILRHWGAPAHAEVLERCAEELEQGLQEFELEPLTLQEAAKESGYSADHLGRLVRQRKLLNVGKANAPRIRRCDFPRKPPRFDKSETASHFGAASKEQIARSIVANGDLR